jgi:hypothetical protein
VTKTTATTFFDLQQHAVAAASEACNSSSNGAGVSPQARSGSSRRRPLTGGDAAARHGRVLQGVSSAQTIGRLDYEATDVGRASVPGSGADALIDYPDTAPPPIVEYASPRPNPAFV